MSTFGMPKAPNWRAVRRDRLVYDEYLCQLQYPGVCILTASEVHHTAGIAARGLTRETAVDDIDMLMSVCGPCHKVITEKQRKAGFNQMQAARARRKKLPRKPHSGEMKAV